ncbi:MAG: protease complex subunit PrcB family protein [Pseudomonadota bacterium]
MGQSPGYRTWRGCAAVAITALLAGCGERSLPVTTVLNYDRCQGLEAGLTLVDYAAVAGIRGDRLLDAGDAGNATAEDDELLLLAVSRGRQPTPGYGFELEGARRRDGTAVVAVRWRTPESGAVLPEVVTHPCLVVGVEPEGLQRIVVRDQTGDMIGALEL